MWGVVDLRRQGFLLSGDSRYPYVEAGLGEGGVDAAEVGFAVADAEGEVVDIGDARARVGVSTLR